MSQCISLIEQEKNVKALLRRGLAYENLERYRSALEDIRNVLAINPSIQMANAAQVSFCWIMNNGVASYW